MPGIRSRRDARPVNSVRPVMWIKLTGRSNQSSINSADLQAAKTGEIDWRPTQTIPVDYFGYGASL